MKKIVILICTFFTLNTNTFAQITFSKYLRLPEILDNGWTIIPEEDGYFIHSGSTCYTDTSFLFCHYFLKSDLYGNLLWAKSADVIPRTYSIASHNSIIRTSDTHYIVNGTKIIDGNFKLGIINKINLEGDTIWSRTYGGNAKKDVAVLTHELKSGNTLTVGWRSFENEPTAMVVVKYSPDGTFLSEKVINPECLEFRMAHKIIATEDGNLIIGFSCYIDGLGGPNTFPSVMKIDTSGQVIWEENLPDWGFYGCDFSRTYIQTLPNGGYAFPWCYPHDTSLDTVMLIGFDANHEIQWKVPFLDHSINNVINILNTTKAKNGDILIVGYNEFHGVFESALGYLARVSPEGNLLWQRFYVLEEDRPWDEPWLNNLAETPDGGIIACGAVKDTIEGPPYDVWLLKTDEDGCLTPGCIEEYIFISKTVQTDEISSDLREVFFQLSPNPTNHIARLNFYNPIQRENALLKVYSMNGQSMYRQVLSKGVQAIDVEVGDYPSGLYVVSLEWEGRVLQKEKLVKQ